MRSIILLLAIFFFSCGDKSSKLKPSPVDTSNVIIIHYAAQYGLREDRATRNFKDTLSWFDTDSLTRKKTWGRYKEYIIQVAEPINDSTGKPLKNKFNQDSTVLKTYGIPSKNIIFDINIDSLTKIYYKQK